MILDKKTMRFIRKYKSKYIGSIIMIALSCMMFIGFNIASPNINTSIDNFRKDTLSENVNFSVENFDAFSTPASPHKWKEFIINIEQIE